MLISRKVRHLNVRCSDFSKSEAIESLCRSTSVKPGVSLRIRIRRSTKLASTRRLLKIEWKILFVTQVGY